MTNDLRALVEKWRRYASAKRTTEYGNGTVDAATMCADELQAALDAQAGMVSDVALLNVIDLLRTGRDGKKWDYAQSRSGSMVKVSHLFAGPVVAQADGWLPIGSAPRDGTDVLVYVRGETLYPTAAHYDTRQYFEKEYGDPEYMEEGWRWSFGYPSDFHEETIEPTHWMPLPAGPVEGGE